MPIERLLSCPQTPRTESHDVNSSEFMTLSHSVLRLVAILEGDCMSFRR